MGRKAPLTCSENLDEGSTSSGFGPGRASVTGVRAESIAIATAPGTCGASYRCQDLLPVPRWGNTATWCCVGRDGGPKATYRTGKVGRSLRRATYRTGKVGREGRSGRSTGRKVGLKATYRKLGYADPGGSLRKCFPAQSAILASCAFLFLELCNQFAVDRTFYRLFV